MKEIFEQNLLIKSLDNHFENYKGEENKNFLEKFFKNKSLSEKRFFSKDNNNKNFEIFFEDL